MISNSNYRRSLRISAVFLLTLSVLALSGLNVVTEVSAQLRGGTVTIHSDGNGESSSSGLSGHSWIEYTPDGGETSTYGTWPDSGVAQDRELGRESEASRTAHISPTQVQNLMNYINEQTALGSDAWTLLHPCSSFASEAWEAATGEYISPGWISNPVTLRDNIIAANGGQPHGSVGGGTHGGVESKPLNTSPSTFLNEHTTNERSIAAPSLQLQQSVKLEDVIPLQGPDTTTAIPTIPVDALALTETVDATAVDFVDDNTGLTKAVLLGIQTSKRPHDHDYAVCNSYHGYSIDNVAPIPFPDLLPGITEEDPPWFWYVLAQKSEFLEEAVTFVVFVNESQRTFVVDSRWLVDYYPEQFSFDFDYIFNFQIWASSSEETYNLLQRTIENLAGLDDGSWTVAFANTVEPSPPTVLIRQAEYHENEAHLTVQSWLTDTRSVTFYGSWRSYDDWETSIGFNYEAEVSPGTSTIILPFENLLDAVIVSNVDGFLSKVYVGSGFWFVFSDDQSVVTMTPGQCAPIAKANNELILAGCPQMAGTITTTDGYVGLVRTLNPNGMPVDINNYQALTFMARGDGKSYQVKLETDAVKDYDYHQFVFTPLAGEWRQYIIPLSLFKQQGYGTPVPFTGTDVKSVAWTSVGPQCEHSVQLDVDRVAFINSPIISGTSGPISTDNTSGPYTITAQIYDDVGVKNAILHYRVNRGRFVQVAMNSAGSTFSGQIPGQSMGSEVHYYIEAHDADGNLATDPVDAPHTTHHFRVERYSSLLLDDFGDRNPYNALKGWSGVFRDPDESGTITPCYDGNVLSLSFDVTNQIPRPEWAGYYTKLESSDLSPYNSLIFRVRGASGGEKLRSSLRDGLGHEPKIELSEYLPRGITTGWQTVRMPRAAFTSITDWSAMDSFNLLAEERINSGSGVIYVDDVNFSREVWPIRLDNFNDLDDQNGVGLLHDTDLGGGAGLDVDHDRADPYGGAGASLALTYNVPRDAYAAWHSGLAGLDVSGYDSLSLVVKGASGNENFHIWLVDEAGHHAWVEVSNYTTITKIWPSVPAEIPLQDFSDQGIDLTRLRLFKVAFEWVPMSSTVYLDDICFTSEGMPCQTSSKIFLPIILKNSQ